MTPVLLHGQFAGDFDMGALGRRQQFLFGKSEGENSPVVGAQLDVIAAKYTLKNTCLNADFSGACNAYFWLQEAIEIVRSASDFLAVADDNTTS